MIRPSELSGTVIAYLCSSSWMLGREIRTGSTNERQSVFGAEPIERKVSALSLKLGSEMAFSGLQVVARGRSQAFSSLTSDERGYLLRWLETVRDLGIDGVEDLTHRAWPCPILGAVIGVFQSGGCSASWLIVGQNGFWVTADCVTGSVSNRVGSLEQALLVLYALPSGVA